MVAKMTHEIGTAGNHKTASQHMADNNVNEMPRLGLYGVGVRVRIENPRVFVCSGFRFSNNLMVLLVLVATAVITYLLTRP
jgi:hypothetical protein